MRIVWIMLAVMAAAPALAAREFDFTSHARPERTLFKTHEASFQHDLGIERFARTPILEDGHHSADQLFGTGVALGLNSAAVGVGFGAFFDFYFTQYLAASAYGTVSYGFVGRHEHNGGDALASTLSLGAKFVVDFDNIEFTNWFRPFVALYPLGFAYYSATEDADIPGSGNTKDVTYADIFFLMTGGVGADFYLTDLVAIGVGVYVWGSIGGSKHKHSSGIETKTSGAVGVYFEYARLTLRF